MLAAQGSDASHAACACVSGPCRAPTLVIHPTLATLSDFAAPTTEKITGVPLEDDIIVHHDDQVITPAEYDYESGGVASWG